MVRTSEGNSIKLGTERVAISQCSKGSSTDRDRIGDWVSRNGRDAATATKKARHESRPSPSSPILLCRRCCRTLTPVTSLLRFGRWVGRRTDVEQTIEERLGWLVPHCSKEAPTARSFAPFRLCRAKYSKLNCSSRTV